MKHKAIRILIIIVLATTTGYNTKALLLKNSSKKLAIRIADCPQIDDSKINIEPASCGNNKDGKITGLTVKGGTGNYTYRWYDSGNQLVGSEADLQGVAPGKYYLQVKDDSKCVAATSPVYTVKVNSIIIDDTFTVSIPTACGKATGSILHITATNATNFVWTNAAEEVVGTALDLKNVPTGNFKLTATNNLGCVATATYYVANDVYFPTLIQTDTIPAVCGGAGGFKLTFLINESDPGFHWDLTPPGNEVQTGIIVSNPDFPGKCVLNVSVLPSKTYTLNVYSNSGCQTAYTLTLNPIDFRIDASHVLIHNDYCGRSIGTIIGLKALGLSNVIPSPYRWYNEEGKLVGGTAFLAGVPAGKYTLHLIDPSGLCSDVKEFTIKDSTTLATPPVAGNVKLCLPGVADIEVANPDTSGYNLYDSTQTFITGNKYGLFPVKVTQTSTFYVTHLTGTCESSKTSVTVTVAIPGVEIPNTFTPNGDGVNDFWKITGIEKYPGVVIDIFTRDGHLIFHSVNYAKSFDGRYNGRELPPGVYYYTIDTKKTECLGQLSGSLTLLR